MTILKNCLSALQCIYSLFTQSFETRSKFFVLFSPHFKVKWAPPEKVHKHARLHIHENGDFLCDANYSFERANFSTRHSTMGREREKQPACVFFRGARLKSAQHSGRSIFMQMYFDVIPINIQGRVCQKRLSVWKIAFSGCERFAKEGRRFALIHH